LDREKRAEIARAYGETRTAAALRAKTLEIHELSKRHEELTKDTPA